MDPASEEAQDKVEEVLTKLSIAVSVAVLSVIARRIGSAANGSSIQDVYKALPQDMRDIDNLLRRGVGSIESYVSRALDTAATDNDKWAEVYYAANDAAQVPWKRHDTISSLVAETSDGFNVDLDGYADSLVIADIDGAPVPLADGVLDAVGTVNSVSGAHPSYRDAIVAAVIAALALHGLRVDRGDGGTRFDVAVTGSAMHAYRGMLADIRKVQGIEFGADGVQLSAHGDSAPDHVLYQGGMYTYEQFDAIQNDLPREYVTGAGCRHFTWPVIVGVDRPAYSEDELDEMYRASTGEVSFTGLSGRTLTKTGYEASQYRRSVERRCRELSTQAELLSQAGRESDVQAVRRELERLRSFYTGLCEETGSVPSTWRTHAYTMR